MRGESLFALAGCQTSAPPPPPALPLAGQTVRLVVPADLALKDLWEPLLQEWQAATGGTAEWAKYDSAHPPWQTEPSATAPPSGGRLIVLPLADLSDADAAEMLSPFPKSAIEAAGGQDIFPGLKEAALSRQKSLVAAPISAPVLLCYYRKDLLDAAGLAPPQTWDEYRKLVEDVAKWAPGLTAVEPAGPKFRASLFLARSAAFCKHPQSYSVWFDIQTGEPLFDLPGFERALETAGAAWNGMPAEIWELSPSECREAVVTGKAALALTWEPSASYPRPERSTMAETDVPSEPFAIGAVSLPGSMTLYNRDANRWEKVEETPHQPGFVGFTGLAMSVHAENSQAAAWHLLGTLTKHPDQAFADRPRSPCRETDMTVLFPSDGFISLETASLIADATAETLRRRDLACDLAIPQADAVRSIIAEELGRWKMEHLTAQAALAAMQTRVSAATKEDRAALRDSYRRSLGLPPLK